MIDNNVCTHLFSNAGADSGYIETVYSDDYFNGGTDGYANYEEHEELLIAQGKKYGNILSRHRQPGTVLDVGAAAGFLLKGLNDAGWQGVGIEPNASMAESARTKFGLEVFQGAFEDWTRQDSFDAVTLIQVISHLRDPVSCLQRIHAQLRSGGLLLIETWNRKSLTARMFGKSWHQYNPPSVLHWYTKKHLKNLLSDCGFELIEQGRPTKWISLGNGVSLIRHSLRDSSVGRIASAPLALVPVGLKVPYFLDDVFWFVARKTG